MFFRLKRLITFKLRNWRPTKGQSYPIYLKDLGLSSPPIETILGKTLRQGIWGWKPEGCARTVRTQFPKDDEYTGYMFVLFIVWSWHKLTQEKRDSFGDNDPGPWGRLPKKFVAIPLPWGKK